MPRFAYSLPTNFSSYGEASYTMIRAMTALDRLVEVTVESLLKGDDDSLTWEIEVEADDKATADAALAKVCKNYPVMYN